MHFLLGRLFMHYPRYISLLDCFPPSSAVFIPFLSAVFSAVDTAYLPLILSISSNLISL